MRPFMKSGAFGIAPARIRALLRLQVAQMFNNQDARLVLDSELDNASAHQMRDLFVHVPDFRPEVGIVLFVFRDPTSL